MSLQLHAEDKHTKANIYKTYTYLALGNYKTLRNSSFFCAKPYSGYKFSSVATQVVSAQVFQNSGVFSREISADICRFTSKLRSIAVTNNQALIRGNTLLCIFICDLDNKKVYHKVHVPLCPLSESRSCMNESLCTGPHAHRTTEWFGFEDP